MNSLIKQDKSLNNIFRLFDIDKFFSTDSFFESNKSLTPKADIYEKDGTYHVDMELAGLKKEDIDIKLQNGVLSISAEKKYENEKEEKNYFYKERSYGMIQRSFYVDKNVTPEDIKAEYTDGVLKLSFPKESLKEETKVKKIDIN